jgi:hypothetical protein
MLLPAAAQPGVLETFFDPEVEWVAATSLLGYQSRYQGTATQAYRRGARIPQTALERGLSASRGGRI